MFLRIGLIIRLVRTFWVLVRYDALVPYEYEASVPGLIRFLGHLSRFFARRRRASNPGERLAQALEKLGPAYIKFGQILATRTDMLNPVFAEGLSRLKDKVPPFSQDKAEAQLNRDWGAPYQDKLKNLCPPVAAASIAQVHQATTHDGKKIAVKILRPHIQIHMQKNLALLDMIAAMAEFFVPESRRLGPKKFVETLRRSVTLELDLRLEAAAMSELAQIAQTTRLFAVPDVHWSLCHKNILVTDWVDGRSLSDDSLRTDPDYDQAGIARQIMQSFLASALHYGVFHADMHEGNMIVREDGTLVLVDFGIVGRLSSQEQRFHTDILYGFLTRNYHRVAQVHFLAGYVPAQHTVSDFASALRSIGEPIFGQKAANVAMTKLLIQLFEITQVFGMQMQPQLILLQKTMMQTEGVCRRLDPEFDMWAISRPIVETAIRRQLGLAGQLENLQTCLSDIHKAAIHLPALTQHMVDFFSTQTNKKDTHQSGSYFWKGLKWAVIGAITASLISFVILT